MCTRSEESAAMDAVVLLGQRSNHRFTQILNKSEGMSQTDSCNSSNDCRHLDF